MGAVSGPLRGCRESRGGVGADARLGVRFNDPPNKQAQQPFPMTAAAAPPTLTTCPPTRRLPHLYVARVWLPLVSSGGERERMATLVGTSSICSSALHWMATVKMGTALSIVST